MNSPTFILPPSSFRRSDHPYPLVFATISRAHLYGFPSPDSDFDLRGVHLLPLEQVVGLEPSEETVEALGRPRRAGDGPGDARREEVLRPDA